MMCTLPCKLKLTRKQIGYEWELENETRPSALGMSDPIWGPLIYIFVDERRSAKDKVFRPSKL